jgi:HK97 family phage major capsid protein
MDRREFGNWLRNVGIAAGPVSVWGSKRDEAREAVRKAVPSASSVTGSVIMGETPGAAGGFAVPLEVALKIDEGMKEIGVFHALARRQPMRSASIQVPMFDITTAHATGASPLFAGFQPQWFNENVNLPESEPGFSMALCTAQNVGCRVYASNQLVQDGGEPLAAFLEWQFTEALEWAVERECFQGTLPGRPVGVNASPATVNVTRQTPSTVTIQDIGSMIASLIPACFRRAVWGTSITALSKIIQQSSSYFIAGDGVSQNGLAGYLAGRPLFATEKLPAVGIVGDVVLFDPGMYVLGTRSIEVDSTTETQQAFEQNQTCYRPIWRGIGQPMAKGSVVLADGTTTAGCYVALK